MGTYIITYSAIAVTAIVSFIAFQNRALFEQYLFSVEKILKKHEYHRTISSAFIHADLGHLIFNMFSFYAFATGIESVYGSPSVAIIFLGGAISGSLLSLLIHRNEPEYRAVGASGAVCGIIFASIFLLPGGSIIIFPLPLPIPAWLYAVLFILASIYGIGRNVGNIGHDAHLGGALAGVAAAYFIFPESVTGNLPLVAGITVPVVLFFILKDRISFLKR
ncbi:MAG TPA: rhomboid family intramembrane serine protease [Spirochaetota bacterium]|nr:rhomboid family intramembrane serine protease [Spirochaetota bacterium]HPF04987.1 rhomboid family intramembrane serine protease [Spirochaetota bacterium]HPR37121.1 rhomboid family intramembrane serine protease [Spirochaetota bacterium]HRX46648.1 rhomboid family intramembrane serine protease [Spirochaetota bacterium]